MASIPNVTTPIVDPRTGVLTSVWLRFIQSLTLAVAQSSGSPQPPATVSVTSSPFNFTASAAGFVTISGGGVTSLAIKRGTSGAVKLGRFYGSFPVASGDIIIMTYVQAPVVTYFAS